ncbi:MAG: hypothetical protein WDA24_03980 [Tissierellales bacterium]
MDNKKNTSKEEKNTQKNVCEECGSIMKPESGCFVCQNCGYSPCSI